MGRAASTNRNQNNNSNQLVLDHLTTNQQHQAVIRSLYASNQHTLSHPGAFIINEAGEPVIRNIKIKKTRPIEIIFQIDKSSVKLNANPDQPNTYHLSFVFNSKIDCKITVYLLTNEKINAGHLTQELIANDPHGAPKPFFFDKGEKVKFAPADYLIRPALYPQKELCEHTESYFPLVIVIEPKTPLEEKKQKLIAYLTFVSINTGYSIKLLRQKLQFPHKAYMLDDIYGFGESGLATTTNAEPDGKNCSVCLAAKIDTIALPCRHMCLCYGCAKEFKKRLDHRCPMCRRNVKSFLKQVQGSKQKWLSELEQ